MKTFKDFINKDKNTNEPTAVFCSAGGPPQQRLIQEPEDNPPAVFCNAGGPREHKPVVKEATRIINSGSNVLRDPIANNMVTDQSTNDHERLVKLPTRISNLIGHERSYPHLTDEQAQHYKALADNTQHGHIHYRYTVSNYTFNSHELNSHLYNAHINKQPHDPIVQSIVVKHLDDLIQQHRTPHPMTVYTGPHFNPHEYAGRQVHLPAFTSTSLSPHVAKDFGMGGHILRIHLPEGHPHLFMDPESNYQGQSELVLPRNMKLRIARQPSHVVSGEFNDHFDDINYEDTPNKIHFWNARIVRR